MHHVFFIGIGGAGMSGLAEILLARGIRVSGSDQSASTVLEQLARDGATIFETHKASNLTDDVDLVIYTSAIDKKTNEEFREAERRHIRTVRRAEALGEIVAATKTIAIAGTHGKTTTSSMIAAMLIEAKLDPLAVIGGTVHELGGKNARAGKGKLSVVEADEFDRSFLALKPYIAIITSLEEEHLDIYRDIEDLKDAFIQFANQSATAERGFAVVSLDAPHVREITPRLDKRIVTYATGASEAKYRATNIVANGRKTRATLWRGGEIMGELELGVPGEHNVRNALAAIAVGEVLAIPFETTRKALKKFVGAERRFQLIGEANGIAVVDDYAHHPSEVRAALSAARTVYPGRRIIACFQPHTFSRTQTFAEEFGRAFAELADTFVLLDIYPSRETPIPGVTSDLIEAGAKATNGRDVIRVGQPEELAARIVEITRSGDVIMTIGAGTVTTAAPAILDRLRADAQKDTVAHGTNGVPHDVAPLSQ